MRNNIEIHRKKNGLTQAELAKLSKVERSHIARLENGVGSPNIRTLEKLAHALNCKVKDLI